MPATTSYALLASGIASVANAYTQVNVPSPFMYKNIDPIVFPGSYTKSHLHSFFGSDSVTASTTQSEELRQGCSNAENVEDLSVYWTPTLLYDNGGTWEPVPIMRFSAYYGLGDNGADVPFPEDFQMVAGDANAQTPEDQPTEAASEWFCEGDDWKGADANGFPAEGCSVNLQQLLYFPQCVNMDTLEYAYKRGRPGAYYECPDGMQAVPQLRFSIRYDMRDILPNGWSGEAPLMLASGNAYSSHGDFINGWTKAGGESLVQATSDKHDFQNILGGSQTMNCDTRDAEPDQGVSIHAESVPLMEGSSDEEVETNQATVETTTETTETTETAPSDEATASAPSPSSSAPSTEAPSTEEPEAPSSEAPSTETPSTEAPSTETPSTETPSTEAPSTEAPSTEAPSTDSSNESSPSGPATKYHQCGGSGYSGPTSCESGCSCKEVNAWYSQCL